MTWELEFFRGILLPLFDLAAPVRIVKEVVLNRELVVRGDGMVQIVIGLIEQPVETEVIALRKQSTTS